MDYYRLPKHIKPLKYQIRIEPTGPDYEFFKGYCHIIFKNSEVDSKIIVINTLELNINNAWLVDRASCIPLRRITYNPETEQTKFVFDKLPQMGMLIIEYTGKILTEPPGFYRMKEHGEWIFCTLFEPTFARKCFPCFDEPNFKAKFSVEIVAPKNKLVLSNMDIKEKVALNGKILYIFHETPKMSTYIVAFYIGHAEFVEGKSRTGVKVRIYGTQSRTVKEEYLKETIQCLHFLEDFFDFPYALPKLDLVYVPVLNAEAMENWGLIVCKRLEDESNLSLLDKIDHINTIYHEIAHQWMGNLVTMDWWGCIWLNESFASWFAVYVLNYFHPEWKPFHKFYASKYLQGFKKDYLTSTPPILQTVNTPAEIDEVFDLVSYAKGTAVLNMFVTYLGLDTFRKGLQGYVKKYQYANVETNDLINCIQEVSNIPLQKYLKEWEKTNGYPIINVYHNHLEQEHYSPISSNSNKFWYIPLTPTFIMEKERLDLVLDKIDKNAFGFYLVNYHPSILEKILEGELSDLDIAKTITNLFMSMAIGKISFQTFLNFLDKLVDITSHRNISFVISATMKYHYQYFYSVVKKQWAIDAYNVVIIKYVERVLNRIGTEYYDHDDIDKLVSRTNCLELACLVGISKYLDYFKALFRKYQKTYLEGKPTQNIIYNNIKSTVFKSVLLYGPENQRKDAFNFLMECNNQKSTNLIFAVVNTPDLDNYLQALELVFSNKLYKDDKVEFLIAAGKNKFLNKYLWKFIKDNWNYIYEIVENTNIPFTNLIEIFDIMVDENGLREDIKSFIMDKNVKRYQKALETIMEKIIVNTNFNNLF